MIGLMTAMVTTIPGYVIGQIQEVSVWTLAPAPTTPVIPGIYGCAMIWQVHNHKGNYVVQIPALHRTYEGAALVVATLLTPNIIATLVICKKVLNNIQLVLNIG